MPELSNQSIDFEDLIDRVILNRVAAKTMFAFVDGLTSHGVTSKNIKEA